MLTFVHGRGNPDDKFVQVELREMCDFERKNSNGTYLEVFKPKMIYRTHVGAFTKIWSQLTGMNVIMYCKLLINLKLLLNPAYTETRMLIRDLL